MRDEAAEAKKGELICLKSMDQGRSQTTVLPSGVDKDRGGLPSWATRSSSSPQYKAPLCPHW